MERKKFLTDLLTRAGMTPAEITETLGDLSGDLADERATAVAAALLTSEEAAASDTIIKPIRQSAKKTALDAVDGVLKPYEGKLTAAQKTEYAKLGNDTNKKSQFLLKAFDEKGTPTGDQAFNDLKTELEELRNTTVPKSDYETVQGQVTAARRSARESEMITSFRLHQNLRDVTNDRHFRQNALTDAEKLLTETGVAISDKTRQKGVIDWETGELRKADKPDEAITVGGRKLTVTDLVDQTVKYDAYDWAKKSDATSSSSVQVQADQQQPALTAAQRRNLAE